MAGRISSSKPVGPPAPAGAATTGPLANTSPESARAPLAIRFLHPPALAGRSQVLNRRVVIGRDPACDLVLEDETISRRHAEANHAGSAYAIADLKSRNGLSCNGVRTELGQIGPGSVVRLGDCVAVICAHVPGDPGFLEVAPDLLGSHALRQVVELSRRAARSLATVLIFGETGTGKELIARLIHETSARSGPFVPVNCGALPQNLVEAELFGHERGAFTGADQARPGLLRKASGGTLFLDEIAELPLTAQAKLLRVLEAREVLPIGRSEPVPVELRVVCATHGDLPALVSAGLFRADLYARLEGITLTLPPLRERKEDIPELFLRFVERYRPGSRPALSASFVEGLCCHDWPRNVRQLRQLAERLSTLLTEKTLWRKRDLRAALPELATLPPAAAGEPPGAHARARKPDRHAIEEALRMANGNVTLAAQRLNLSKQTLYTLIKQLGLDLAKLRDSNAPPREPADD